MIKISKTGISGIFLSFLLTLTLMVPSSCDVLQEFGLTLPESLSEDDIVAGLKEALRVGTENGVNYLNREDGYFGDPLVRIPFPEEAKIVEEKLRAIGLDRTVDNFILTMNRGAENAVGKASPIFLQAIKEMSFTDARKILEGTDNEATLYFHDKTYDKLMQAFQPDVKESLEKVHLTSYWDDVTKTYNKIPFTKEVETDLSAYVTGKTIDGLFNKIALEEKLIRDDPQARVNDILRKVFGEN